MEKETVKISLDENKVIELTIEKGSKNKKTIEMVKRGVKMAIDYFDDVKKINFKIELIYSREEFDKKIGFHTQDWVTANSFGKSFMVFDPNKIEFCTSHKKEEFIPIITHETIHILHKKINTNFSYWLSEGLAQNIAKQGYKTRIETENFNYFVKYNLFKNSDYNKFISKQGYEMSYKLINFLMNKYSKKQIISLLKIKYSPSKSSEENFCRVLKIGKKELIKMLEGSL